MKIWFQAGLKGVPNFRSHVEKYNSLGIPVYSAEADSTSTMLDIIKSGKLHNVQNTFNWTPTRSLTKEEMKRIGLDVTWTIDPNVPYLSTYIDGDKTRPLNKDSAEHLYERYAKIYVDAILEIAPKDRDNDYVTISTWNEVRPYVGWGPENALSASMWSETIEGYSGWAEAIAHQGYYIAKELVTRRSEGKEWFRWAPYAFAGGNPEFNYWRVPAVLEFLRYMSDNRDMFRMCLHEYSFADDIFAGANAGMTHIGRHIYYVKACKDNNIEPLSIEIKEFGWYQNRLPNISKDKLFQQLHLARIFYKEQPYVVGAALWTLAGGMWSGVSDDLFKLADLWLSEAYEQVIMESKNGSLIYGVDSSATKVLSNKIPNTYKFGIQRAIQRDGGQPIVDGQLANVDAYRSSGMLPGVYCLVVPEELEKTASMFASIVKELVEDGPILWPVIDIENTRLTLEDVILFIDTFVAELGSKKFIIYTSKSRWQLITNNSALYKDNPLWTANYTTATDLTSYDVLYPSVWDTWDIWQYSQNVPIEGMLFDLNVMKSEVFHNLQFTKENVDESIYTRSKIHHIIGEPTEEDLTSVIVSAYITKEPIVFTNEDVQKLDGKEQIWNFSKGTVHMLTISTISQRDERWANIKLGTAGSTTTIGKFGCLTVAYTMLAHSFDLLPSNNPIELMNIGVANGAYWNQYIQPHALRTMFPEDVESHGWKTRNDPTMLTDLVTWLDNKIAVPARVDFNPATSRLDQHWILLIGYEKSATNTLRYIMADPWTGKFGFVDDEYDIAGVDILECLFYKKRVNEDPPKPLPNSGNATTTANVNLRSSPALGNNIIQIIPKGTIVYAYRNEALQNGYVHCDIVSIPGIRSGYIYGTYLSYVETTSTDIMKYFMPPSGERYGTKIALQYNWNGGGSMTTQLQNVNGDSVVMKDGQYELRTFKDGLIHLVEDTSYEDGKFYRLNSPDGWLKQMMYVGQLLTRHETVSIFNLKDCSHVTTYAVTTQIKFNAKFAKWTSEGGLEFNDVVEFTYIKDGVVIESYWYASGVGLVQWQNNAGWKSSATTYLSHESNLSYVRIRC